ncbi:MAG: CoA transferase [Candidatus Marinimicrobia bacterium]|jgi:crotonobetainyl-CoA:carnitine CoA-transferase CaiB-like acyl-CoA transferase|nr:CoA transferase [Candidatus Neomarinimicrobiota bacterium]MBT3937977.1 CoA transferase [Candidatus Neomarinimicrobiota bacterium]MBT3962235.1 CoA transferase [Candidatus Neomarinimicrobiota bacterium]MBT4383808.1 CoA transferase [Candidatus Neomarinimicrobiota bacterium]MBT4636900.1 CoA transferase [Candidatus Neomarinimicrobiota bacterium]
MERPLTGIRVIALEQYMAAPYCSMLLADAGAEVIKIERPGTGDPRRSIPPFAKGENGEKKAGGFMAYNRNKKSFALNMRSDEGKQIYKDLIKSADIVVENLRPGSTDKMGVGYNDLKEINPKLIYAAISGFGRMEGYEGPDSNRPAFDIVAEAMSGIMHLVGFEDKPPSWTIYGLADVYSGLCTSFAIMQALFMRERTGKGQFVDSAMLDNMLSLNERMAMLYSITGNEPHRGRLTHLYPRGAFKCKDGYLAMNIPDDMVWARLCTSIEREDLVEDKRSKTGNDRAANAKFLGPIIEEWLSQRTRAEAEKELNGNGVPVGSVYTAKDVFDSNQIQKRKALVNIIDPDVGSYQFARGPVMLSDAPEIETNPAPELGEHTQEILKEILHYSESEIIEFENTKTIQTHKK